MSEQALAEAMDQIPEIIAHWTEQLEYRDDAKIAAMLDAEHDTLTEGERQDARMACGSDQFDLTDGERERYEQAVIAAWAEVAEPAARAAAQRLADQR